MNYPDFHQMQRKKEGVEILSSAHIRTLLAKAVCVGAGKANHENFPNARLGVPLHPQPKPSQWSSLKEEDPTFFYILYVEQIMNPAVSHPYWADSPFADTRPHSTRLNFPPYS